jgi:tyrosinase
MRTEIALNGSTSPAANYIGWSPRPGKARLSDAAGAAGPVNVTLRNERPAGGQVVFSKDGKPPFTDTLQLTLPQNGTPVDFFVAGKFDFASANDKDAAIEVIAPANQVLSLTQLMVRVRKDANALTPGERDRFISAFAELNNKGAGPFRDFRDMHDGTTLLEAHGNQGFLPWHRAYLLDLERELQAIDASVALHYWRFDRPAPNIFTADFLGETVEAPEEGEHFVRFSETNPLQFWQTELKTGVDRSSYFDTQTSGPITDLGTPVMNEGATIALGSVYVDFVRMERQPHGAAHRSFSGYIDDPGTAPCDPLFFLLHSNVDRLWAMWQWKLKRFDPSKMESYRFQRSAGQPGARRIGHNKLDSMWPWNGVMGSGNPDDRPPTAPGGPLASSTIASAPPPSPLVGDMIDYQGHFLPSNWLGFDYHDVPYEA